MFCLECICHSCPYGLKCYICNRRLDDHIIISEGCNGDRKSNMCPLDYMANNYTEPKHADIMRELIRNNDSKGIEAFFDFETGSFHEKDRARLAEMKGEK